MLYSQSTFSSLFTVRIRNLKKFSLTVVIPIGTPSGRAQFVILSPRASTMSKYMLIALISPKQCTESRDPSERSLLQSYATMLLSYR